MSSNSKIWFKKITLLIENSAHRTQHESWNISLWLWYEGENFNPMITDENLTLGLFKCAKHLEIIKENIAKL